MKNENNSENVDRKQNKKLELFKVFFKIGICTFGGGYAMIPLIKKELVDKEHWIDEQEIIDIIAVSETTPGPVAINLATFIGTQIAGFWGALFATLGVICPSFFIILILALFLRQIEQNTYVAYAFKGIRIGVLTLIINALFTLGKQCKKTVFNIVLMLGAFILVAFLKVNAILVIVLCAVIGLTATRINAGKAGDQS